VGLKHERRPWLVVPRHAFSRTPRGFEDSNSAPIPKTLPTFSRTPRGFEAPTVNGVELDGVLSAEPLVGLKQHRTATHRYSTALSAEPLVGLKPVIAPNVMAPIPHFQPNPSWV